MEEDKFNQLVISISASYLEEVIDLSKLVSFRRKKNLKEETRQYGAINGDFSYVGLEDFSEQAKQ